MKRSNIIFIFLLLIIFVLCSQADLSAQCAMCKAGAESSLKNPNSVARGLNSGILYLMAVPYVLIAFLFRKQIAKLWRSKFGKTPEAEI